MAVKNKKNAPKAESVKTFDAIKVTPVPQPAPVVSKPVETVAQAKKPAVAKKAAQTISAEDRRKMIDEAAYYRAEKMGWQVDPHTNWVAAEAEINEMLTKKGIKVSG